MILLWVRAGRPALRVASRTQLVEVAALGDAFALLAGLQFSASGGDALELALQRYLPVPLLV